MEFGDLNTTEGAPLLSYDCWAPPLQWELPLSLTNMVLAGNLSFLVKCRGWMLISLPCSLFSFLPVGTTGHAAAARGAPRAMMSCLKSNQKLTSPWLFVSASALESSQMLWKAGSRLFIQQRISPKHTFYQPSWLSIKGGTSYSFSEVRQAQKPFSSKLQLPPHLLKPACWRRSLQTVTCLRSIGCCCSCALVDGLFKRLHMLVEGKAAEYIKQALRTTLWSG